MTDLPADPLNVYVVAAVSLHEMFCAYVDAGFTEPQAMQLVTAQLMVLTAKQSD